jgi:hypothetical protein
MFNLKDLIPQVLAEMEARKAMIPGPGRQNLNRKTEQLALFGNIYELYDEERAELNRIFSEFEKSFERKSRKTA